MTGTPALAPILESAVTESYRQRLSSLLEVAKRNRALLSLDDPNHPDRAFRTNQELTEWWTELERRANARQDVTTLPGPSMAPEVIELLREEEAALGSVEPKVIALCSSAEVRSQMLKAFLAKRKFSTHAVAAAWIVLSNAYVESPAFRHAVDTQAVAIYHDLPRRLALIVSGIFAMAVPLYAWYRSGQKPPERPYIPETPQS